MAALHDRMNNGPAARDDLRVLACVRELPQRSEGERVISLLGEKGCAVTPVTHGIHDTAGFDLLLVLGNLLWFPDMLKALESGSVARPPIVSVWHWEPLPPASASGLPRPWPTLRDVAKWVLRDPRMNDVYSSSACLRRVHGKGLVDLLFTSTRGRIEYLAEQGIDAAFTPLGYHPEHGVDQGLDRDIPVLFLGEQRVKRRKDRLRFLQRQGVEVKTLGDWWSPQFWGEDRTALLNRTRIFLNLQRFRGEFSGLRLILGMANGCLVLSEPMYRHEPFVAGEHFISAPSEDMPRLIRHFLDNEEERLRIANQGRDFVLKHMRLEQSVSRLLAAVRDRMANS